MRCIARPEISLGLRNDLLALLHNSLDVRRLACVLSLGKTETSPFSDQLVRAGREIWWKSMENILDLEKDVREEDKLIRREPEMQEVLMWRSIGLHLRLSGDPDWAISAAKEACFLRGVRLGLDGLMPAVYQRKVRWQTYDEVWDGESFSKANYKS
eukprot:5881163-Karenia_brevis.AAC.1